MYWIGPVRSSGGFLRTRLGKSGDLVLASQKKPSIIPSLTLVDVNWKNKSAVSHLRNNEAENEVQKSLRMLALRRQETATGQ